MHIPAAEIGAAGAILTAVGVDAETVEKISLMLRQHAEELEDHPPQPTAPSAFGPRASGLDLDAQTAKAHQHVVEAIRQMTAGLLTYRDNLQTFGADMDEVDTNQAVDLNRRRSQLDQINLARACTTQSDFTSASTEACTIPTPETDALAESPPAPALVDGGGAAADGSAAAGGAGTTDAITWGGR